MRTLLLFLLLACAASAAPPRAVKLDVQGDTVLVVRSFKRPLVITAAPGADIYVWSYPDAVKAGAEDGVLTVTSAPKGEHRVAVTSLTFSFNETTKRWDKTRDVGATVIVVGDVPGPGPDPTPPDPPKPVPIPGDGLRMLMIYESAEVSKLPEAQRSAIFSKKVRDYLNDRCPAGPDGKTREWRIWDKDTDAAAESKLWQDALARPRTLAVKDAALDRFEVHSPSGLVATFPRREDAVRAAASTLPWVVISNGKDGFEGPLPTTADGTLALLKKYGG